MDEPRWTPKLVAAILEEAADTLRRLPRVKVQGYISAWPPVLHDFWDAFGWEEAEVRLGPPSARAIDHMDHALLWLRWLDQDEQAIVWDRANRRPWKAIAQERSIDRTTAWRRWTYALITLAARLNV